MVGKTIEVTFVKSSNDLKSCPSTKLPEFAFIGRSNVGKSSLINMLAGNKSLAKISVKPGKTQLINHFEVSEIIKSEGKIVKNKAWYLVDLPGYGYARTSKINRTHFDVLISGYVTTRLNLHCLFVLIDVRLEPQKKDIDFINFLGQIEVPFVLVFTKADKISSNQAQSNIQKFRKVMLQSWETFPEFFVTSSVTKSGKEPILTFIEKTIKLNVKKK